MALFRTEFPDAITECLKTGRTVRVGDFENQECKVRLNNPTNVWEPCFVVDFGGTSFCAFRDEVFSPDDDGNYHVGIIIPEPCETSRSGTG